MTSLTAFAWYGGKATHLDWLLPLLPDAAHYCEPFGGAASCLLNRPRAILESYNDIDGGLVNFFRVLRDEPDALIRKLSLTPYSFEEYKLAIELADDPVECARRFFVRTFMAYAAVSQKLTHPATGWARSKSGRNSRAGSLRKIEFRLEAVAQRFRGVQIFQHPALDMIDEVDEPGALFYCDLPYALDSRTGGKAYANELTRDDHLALIDRLESCKGKVALSGYATGWLDDRLCDWHRFDAGARACASSIAGRAQPGKDLPPEVTRREVLWTNHSLDFGTLFEGARAGAGSVSAP